MKVFRHIEEYSIQDAQDPIVLSIGNFDGVHLGHQEVISKLKEKGREKNLKTCVLTFDPHPKKILFNQDFRVLQDLEEKCNALNLLKLDLLITQMFDKDFAQLSAEEFITNVLVNRLNTKFVVIGEDFSCGANGTGDIDFIKETLTKCNIEYSIVPPYIYNTREVHSTMIRQLIQNGQVDIANEYLFSTYSLSGRVLHGRQVGVELGFPTINFTNSDKVIPAKGIYFTSILIDGKYYDSVTNIGICPTFGVNPLSIETHILDFNKDIYGKYVDLFIHKKLRPEIKFESKEALIDQIQKDVDARRAYKVKR